MLESHARQAAEPKIKERRSRVNKGDRSQPSTLSREGSSTLSREGLQTAIKRKKEIVQPIIAARSMRARENACKAMHNPEKHIRNRSETRGETTLFDSCPHDQTIRNTDTRSSSKLKREVVILMEM
jgi:hypothetical protein